jgi:hypothetical protein
VRPAIFLAFNIEAWDSSQDVQPRARVAADLDLGADGPERVECLVEQVADHPCLGLIAGCADVADRQVIVGDTHMALHKPGHLPLVSLAIVVLEDEDVATAGCAAIAFAAPLLIRVGQRRANGGAQRGVIGRLGCPDAVRKTTLVGFHGASCRTA